MKVLIKLSLSTLLLCLSFSIGYSQVRWKMEHRDFDGEKYFAFTAISCFNNVCTAGGSIISTTSGSLALWRSEDGGKSWSSQDPGIPAYYNLSLKDYIADIQQIDSLFAVSVGMTWEDSVQVGELVDSGLILWTTDGGKTWTRLPIKNPVEKVHFHDRQSGIIIVKSGSGLNPPNALFTTTDSAKHWIEAPLKVQDQSKLGYDFASCYSYGSGVFQAFKAGRGVLYTTNDNWQTHVESPPIISDDPNNYYFLSDCNFSGGDTLIVLGRYSPTGDITKSEAVIYRSTDKGQTWSQPQFPGGTPMGSMTTLSRDTILAFAASGASYLLSSDRGNTWVLDTMSVDTAYPIKYLFGVDLTADGHPIGIASAYGTNNPSILIRGEFGTSQVKETLGELYPTQIFPNPAHDLVIIQYAGSEILIIDPLGKTIESITTNGSSTNIDSSHYPNGIYRVLSNQGGRLLEVGKFVVAH